MEMSHDRGFERVASFESENTKVFAVCLLNSGVKGLSVEADQASAQQSMTQTLLLGCNRGKLIKY